MFRNIFGILAVPFGYLMQGIYFLFKNYGVTIIFFTFVVRLLMLPLRIKQQKSSAKQMAYQPMIQEIQNKWKNDRKRQQEEIMKFQEENGIKMTAGCLPMILDMFVMFSIIQVIYMPLKYILHLNEDAIQAGINAVIDLGGGTGMITDYTAQSHLIGAIISGIDSVKNAVSAVDPTALVAIENFNFNFLGLNLATVPDFSFETAPWQYMILPVLSIVAMFASQFIIMKTSGNGNQQQGKGMMWGMTIVMGVMFGTFAFRVPVGFSLYYTTSSVVATIVQLIVRKIIDPEKIKQEIIEEIEANKKAKKEKKKVEIKSESGEVITKSVTESELVKLRLAKARELDAIKYSDDSMSYEENEAAKKARQIDDKRYGKVKEDELKKVMDKKAAIDEKKEKMLLETSNNEEAEAEVKKEKVILEVVDDEDMDATTYKPGRRMKNRQKQKNNKKNNSEME